MASRPEQQSIAVTAASAPPLAAMAKQWNSQDQFQPSRGAPSSRPWRDERSQGTWTRCPGQLHDVFPTGNKAACGAGWKRWPVTAGQRRPEEELSNEQGRARGEQILALVKTPESQDSTTRRCLSQASTGLPPSSPSTTASESEADAVEASTARPLTATLNPDTYSEGFVRQPAQRPNKARKGRTQPSMDPHSHLAGRSCGNSAGKESRSNQHLCQGQFQPPFAAAAFQKHQARVSRTSATQKGKMELKDAVLQAVNESYLDRIAPEETMVKRRCQELVGADIDSKQLRQACDDMKELEVEVRSGKGGQGFRIFLTERPQDFVDPQTYDPPEDVLEQIKAFLRNLPVKFWHFNNFTSDTALAQDLMKRKVVALKTLGEHVGLVNFL